MEGMETKKLVYMYRRPDDKKAVYKVLDVENDGQRAQGDEIVLSKKIIAGNSGVMFEAQLGKGAISHDKNVLPIDIWKNKDDLLEWQAKDKAFMIAEKIKRTDRSNDVLSECLAPLRRIYREECRDSVSRAALLGRVIDYIIKF